MAVERAREYELREKILEKSTLDFYREATVLLSTQGSMHVSDIHGSYLWPVADHGQGGPIEVRRYEYQIPRMLFACRVREGDAVGTVVLSSLTNDREFFVEHSKEISSDILYGQRYVTYHSFDLYVANGEPDVVDVIQARKIALDFSPVGSDEKDDRIVVYGKKIFRPKRFVQDVTQETFDEYQELIGLVKSFNMDSGSYEKIVIPQRAPITKPA